MCCVLDFGYSTESLYTTVPPGQVYGVGGMTAFVLLTHSGNVSYPEYSKLFGALTKCLKRLCDGAKGQVSFKKKKKNPTDVLLLFGILRFL